MPGRRFTLDEVSLPPTASPRTTCCKMVRKMQNESPFCSRQFSLQSGNPATFTKPVRQNASILQHFPVNDLPPPLDSRWRFSNQVTA